MEILLLWFFSAALLGGLVMGWTILPALIFGYCLFFGYGLFHGKTPAQMLCFSLRGIGRIRKIILTLLLIFVITAVWRAAGTIAYIVYYASALCHPAILLPACFLLCSLISFLTGTSFGSAATIGVICMTIANSSGLPPLLSGGAIMSGIFFGDRCSPVSSSALLVSELTKTDLYRNIRNMMRTAVVPFLLTTLIYLILGFFLPVSPGQADSTREILKNGFTLSPFTLLPVLIVLVFPLLRIKVPLTLACSALCGLGVAHLVQGLPLSELPRLCLYGFQPAQPMLAKLMAGGGILSMAQVLAIVFLSSSYAGMFEYTGFLDGIGQRLLALSRRTSPFVTLTLVSIVCSAVSCNQTLASILCHSLCHSFYEREETLALDLENTVIVIAPLIPWSIAGAVPMAAIDAPASCLLAACYLYLIPLWNLFVRWREGRSASASLHE